ncbi:MAG: glycosyl hydrolase family 18 protein, partial [Oscillospiraceae bacterium]|nr:glycosyl hydrolase family 18 protein [Oscillospiraceae bacterium]
AAVSDESAESVNAASDAASNAASATAPAFATATATAIDAAELFVFEHYDGWYKARAKDGTVGYIEKKYVSVRMYVDTVALLDNDTEVWKPDRGKINMTWDLLATSAPDISEIQDMPGLDVISPTWFELADKDGVVTSIASTEYIEWAHNRGYKVWALFRNNFNDIGMTSAFMNNSLSREEAIRSILIYAAILKIDGINLDFENMYLRDREAYTQFVREFAPMIREQGLTFSVCVNIPDGSNNWSKCFDSPAIADASDYIAVTTYDQTGASSSTPGSVAQYNWVETNVKKMVERDGVPPEKLILGIPFYTRLWEVESGSAANPKVLKTRAIHMDTAINMVTENSAEIIWDKPSAQFYSEFTMDGGSYRMWLDEMNSINYKTSLVHKYDLAGVSSWARAFAHPDVWDVIRRNLKVVETYRQWAEANDGRDPEFMFYN